MACNFQYIIISLQDLSKALFCIPAIIKDYKYSHVLSLTSYNHNHGYVNYVFMHSILDVSGAIIITIMLAILGLIIYLASKRISFKCFGLALSLSMILSRLLLYMYIFFYRNYQINDEGLISEKLNINSLVIYTALILLFAFLLYILFKSLNMPTIATGLFWLTLDGKNIDALYNMTFTDEDTYNQKREAFEKQWKNMIINSK